MIVQNKYVPDGTFYGMALSGLFNHYFTPRGWVALIGSVHTDASLYENAYN